MKPVGFYGFSCIFVDCFVLFFKEGLICNSV